MAPEGSIQLRITSPIETRLATAYSRTKVAEALVFERKDESRHRLSVPIGRQAVAVLDPLFWPARHDETLLMKAIYEFHPDYVGSTVWWGDPEKSFGRRPSRAAMF